MHLVGISLASGNSFQPCKSTGLSSHTLVTGNTIWLTTLLWGCHLSLGQPPPALYMTDDLQSSNSSPHQFSTLSGRCFYTDGGRGKASTLSLSHIRKYTFTTLKKSLI